MLILQPGDKLFPIASFGGIRLFGVGQPEAIISGDGSNVPIVLRDKLMALSPTSFDAFAANLSHLNSLLAKQGKGEYVVSRTTIHHKGDEVDWTKHQEVSEMLAKSVIELVGFNFLQDTLDRQTVVVVLGYPTVFGGQL